MPHAGRGAHPAHFAFDELYYAFQPPRQVVGVGVGFGEVELRNIGDDGHGGSSGEPNEYTTQINRRGMRIR
jgi:hypothetical protein